MDPFYATLRSTEVSQTETPIALWKGQHYKRHAPWEKPFVVWRKEKNVNRGFISYGFRFVNQKLRKWRCSQTEVLLYLEMVYLFLLVQVIQEAGSILGLGFSTLDSSWKCRLTPGMDSWHPWNWSHLLVVVKLSPFPKKRQSRARETWQWPSLHMVFCHKSDVWKYFPLLGLAALPHPKSTKYFTDWTYWEQCSKTHAGLCAVALPLVALYCLEQAEGGLRYAFQTYGECQGFGAPAQPCHCYHYRM